MKTIIFDSPYQAEVEASEHGGIFRRGEPQEVHDDVAEALLKHPHFREVVPDIPASASAAPEDASTIAPAPLAVIPEPPEPIDPHHDG